MDQCRDRPSIPEGTEGAIDRRADLWRLVSAATHQRHHRALVAELRQRTCRLGANLRIIVVQPAEQGHDHGRIVEGGQGQHSRSSDVRAGVAERTHQRGDGAWVADRAERLRRRSAHVRVRILQPAEQQRRRIGQSHLAGRTGGLLAHGGIRVLEGDHQRVSHLAGGIGRHEAHDLLPATRVAGLELTLQAPQTAFPLEPHRGEGRQQKTQEEQCATHGGSVAGFSLRGAPRGPTLSRPSAWPQGGTGRSAMRMVVVPLGRFTSMSCGKYPGAVIVR